MIDVIAILGRRLALLLLILSCTACWYKEHNATVAVLRWERRIPVERLETERRDGWQIPPGGRIVATDYRLYTYDHYVCRYETKTTTTWTGTGKNRRSSTTTSTVPVYCDRPVYRDYYFYDLDVWNKVRQFEASGSEKEKPRWPDASDINDCQETVVGCERLGSRIEHFLIAFLLDDGSSAEADVLYSLWVGRRVGEQLVIVTWGKEVTEVRV